MDYCLYGFIIYALDVKNGIHNKTKRRLRQNVFRKVMSAYKLKILIFIQGEPLSVETLLSMGILSDS